MKSIILAGGNGSRLWPLSSDTYPKQLLNLDANESLLQQTFIRLNKICNVKDIVTITNVRYMSDIKFQLNQIDKKNIVISEPLEKNTAPAVACTLEYFRQKSNKDDIVLIVPSDHLIKDVESFNKSIEFGKILAEKGYLVTFGIKPTYPETGYGYIKTGSKILTGYIVQNFVEKPDVETANEYLENENYYWNCGIFMGKISTFMQEFKANAGDIYNNLKNLDILNTQEIKYDIYKKMPSISLDYAIMEKSSKLTLIELKSDWSDLGSWKSLYEIKDKDKNGNVLKGKVIADRVKNSFIYSQERIVAVSGLENIVLVETKDAIMACKIEDSQNVKKIYEKFKQQDFSTMRFARTAFKPGEYYNHMDSDENYFTKIICLKSREKLSIPPHNYCSEYWVILKGRVFIKLKDKEYILNSGDNINIPIKTKCFLQNNCDKDAKIIMIQVYK